MATPMKSPFVTDVLAGQVAIVTGGSSGIGFEIARQLGLHGASVIITGRRADVLQKATEALAGDGVQALGLQGDVRDSAACEGWVAQAGARFGGLNILVNCAAGNFLANAHELSQGGFRTVMEIDAVGTFTMSRAAFPALKRAPGGGCIVNISATLQYGATWYQVHASAAKAAVDSITRSLALEWGEFGVRVNGVAPGPIEGTAGMAKLAPDSGAASAMQAVVVGAIPLGRMGQKWDIGMAVVYLASPAGRFVSGDTLVVDGASWLYKPPLVPRQAVTSLSRGVEGRSRKVGVASKL